MDTSAPINLRYEDIALGTEFETAAHTVTEADIAVFADVTRDHHPLHLDAGYAKSRGFPAVIGHGLFGLSLMEGLKSELKLYEETSVASLGWDEVKFKGPIVAGDSCACVSVSSRSGRPKIPRAASSSRRSTFSTSAMRW
ncbi:MaoC family dehydratase [Bradyrhizobium diazoefficiens]|jgi:acyl dehydratase|uniref:MaoC family dehydratase n=1 Tax=Bradyrhizobium diazoefficiens TaxID=1355477 RepID=UPI00272B870E|nr:MaoC family dehydratase [Bradyrhizobium diazoefficiens]WLA68208.1 MaoC family dehydratase [Bradyrhizobium diazoefficiens]